jgi:large subunit ribosomal protein L2
MGLKKYKPFTNGRRHMVTSDFDVVTEVKPEKKLLLSKKRCDGRNSSGRITVRHRGGGAKRHYRIVDFLQSDKLGVPGKVHSIAYDPNRTAYIALIWYADGDKRYALAHEGMKVDSKILCDVETEVVDGNRMQLQNIPEGFAIHNIEMQPGKGGQVVRSAGVTAKIMSKEGKKIQVKMPSGEVRLFEKTCYATLGMISNMEKKNMKIGKAGRKRLMGRRPQVRGKAMNVVDHPHGGGEGRAPIGMKYPKTKWGAHALGVKTRRNSYSDAFILANRHKAKK